MNDAVYVKLTEHGMNIVALENKKIQDQTKIQYDLMAHRKVNVDGFSEWQLWELMSIFGSYLYNGSSIPFEQNRIHVKPNLI